MGIVISHSTNDSRSATTVANLGTHLAHALPSGDWRKIRPLFDGRFSDVASIPPKDAGQYAQILYRAANSNRMPGEWAGLALVFAAAAERAAGAREHWTWT